MNYLKVDMADVIDVNLIQKSILIVTISFEFATVVKEFEIKDFSIKKNNCVLNGKVSFNTIWFRIEDCNLEDWEEMVSRTTIKEIMNSLFIMTPSLEEATFLKMSMT